MAGQIIDSIVLAGLAASSVGLWTLRVACTADRRLLAAAGIAAVEATAFALAFSRLLASLQSVLAVSAYALGVAGGTMAALRLDVAVRRRVQDRMVAVTPRDARESDHVRS